MTDSTNERMIDRWFPIAAVDGACGTPAGSGVTEKAIFTWFASRPIAQARAAALTALLPYDENLKKLIEQAIRTGKPGVMESLASAVQSNFGETPPTVLDMFSGRAIIPLEAARAGARAIGVDLSPVATLAGRLLADYPSRDWSSEPLIRLVEEEINETELSPEFGDLQAADRLARDVGKVLTAIGLRVAKKTASFYPFVGGCAPWGYLWTITIPCDSCKRRFPLLGSLVLRFPCSKTNDLGQSLFLSMTAKGWSAAVIDGPPTQDPTYRASFRGDGTKKKGKSAVCLACRHVHSLEAVKAKGEAGEYQDVLIAVASGMNGRREFRVPSDQEIEAACCDALLDVEVDWPYSIQPNEAIPAGNVHTVMASGYGYRCFGDLMNVRQTRLFVETVLTLREMRSELLSLGVSSEYTRALIGYAASTVCRQLRYSTRGIRLRVEGCADGSKNNNVRCGDLFTNQASINFQFDYLETGPTDGPGTWASVSRSSVAAIEKVLSVRHGLPVSARRASATALPLRDEAVDVLICDPPYYDMIEYADASDFFHVWLKRALFDIEPDLFGPSVQESTGLQDKDQEIIVRRVHEPGRVRHDTQFYESMLGKSFNEARRVLKRNGHLVVIFGHSDPDAWRRLLGALTAAGFVVTSAWPSRTETANTGVASIKVTVTIGCRVASDGRPPGIAAEVDREVANAVSERIRSWDADGLALEDQLMASYGPAMEVYGRYSTVINPDGTEANLDRYLTIARKAVRDAMSLRIDELPLETFDAITRFSVFWLRAKGRTEVPKGEARFFAQADELRLEELRGRILSESKAGFRLTLDAPAAISEQSSMFEVVRAMSYAWECGGTEAVADVMAQGGRDTDDRHLWAVVAELANTLPASDVMAKALAGIKRTSSAISMLVGSLRESYEQASLFDELR